MLRERYRVDVQTDWNGGNYDLMIALHARRSAASVAAWRAQAPEHPLILVLTGTDLYHDVAVDLQAQASLEAANRLVVLNELGARQLPPHLRDRAHVVLQSCASRKPVSRATKWLRAVMVGHLRAVKSPQTVFSAARLLTARRDIRIDLVGSALDDELGAAAAACSAELPGFRWLGARSHAQTRRIIQAAHVLVHPSTLEGGAHVVIEAIRSGTPVLASRIDGNVGLLGADYDGYFPVGDAPALARLLERARDEPAWLQRLQTRCALRAPWFEPAREARTLLALVDELIAARCPPLPPPA